ncbi:MAG: DNA primase DnaG [Sulfolobales archaeon]
MKYMIRAKIEIEGIVERPDIIGAIFGQTEGLFGSEFDLRDLQEKGRIGRIYVETKSSGGKTVGEIIIPSNLDKSETALLAAMIESVDRVGPYNAKIHVIDLIDLRVEKIKRIVERAKELMNRWGREKTLDLKEVLNEINSVVKIASIATYGPEKLPAGPEVASSDTIIIVEGRADVINLLRAGYKNAIAIEGAQGKVPESLIKLAQKKNVIVFLDGDRAGDMILKNLIENNLKIDYVARAPPGKEVEELSIREIEKALKNAVPLAEYVKQYEKKKESKTAEVSQVISREETKVSETFPETAQETQQTVPATPQQIVQEAVKEQERIETASLEKEKESVVQETSELVSEKREIGLEALSRVPDKVSQDVRELIGTLNSILYDSSWNPIKKISVRDLYEYLEKNGEESEIYAIALDGIVTKRLVDIAKRRGVKILIGYRISSQTTLPVEEVQILTFDDLIKKSSS